LSAQQIVVEKMHSGAVEVTLGCDWASAA